MAKKKSVRVHRRVLEVAATMLAANGMEATSMDAIAAAAKVSKATLYNHWPNKDELCLEVLGYIHGLDEPAPDCETGDLRLDLVIQLSYEPASERAGLRERIWPHAMAYMSKNHAFGAMWRAKVMEPIQKRVMALLDRGVRQGKVQPGLDPDLVMAMMLGPLIYRNIFLRKNGKRGPEKLEVAVVDAFLKMYGTGVGAVGDHSGE